ncbi:peptide transporter [Fervidicella metallireducens AeB]|uniref:Peptide transporter n=1 Tax=Fervidicella metallireducens AeB TaxID=1403537 RepID=A0A017RTM3_9CLOT|nr:oligopeptide transporter, OPT family [Fervidicella metallireducens]EYE88073.1 peptide transporter [Fervidicella metallireducens AeB]
MSEKKGLSHGAYGGIRGEDYVPYVSASEAMPELTGISMFIGILLAVIFAAANTYLALNVGMTIAAGIPAAILGTGLLKFIFRRNNILEANMISGVAAMGESLAGGIVFTLPAILIWGMNLSLMTIVVVTLLGGLLGIIFVVPLRKYLIVEEHGKLAFPESIAAAEVLVNSNAGGDGFKTVLTGLTIGGIYKFLSGGLLLWQEEPEWSINLTQGGKSIYQTIFGMDAMAALAGVGFIVGIEAALYMFAGSLVAYFGLIPLIKYVGEGLTTPLFPATVPIAEMSAAAVRSSYIRYIGAGAVAAGGFISLAKSLPTIIRSFKAAMSGIGAKGGTKRTDLDIPMTWVIGGAALTFFLAWFLPMTKVGLVGSFLAVLFAFFFAVVSARICGIIGASNNPVSGMTIATLLFVTSVLKAIGYVGDTGMLVAITVGGIVCVAISVSGGAGQALKTTYIIGGTPKKVQIGMYLGIALAGIAAGATMLLLAKTYGIGDNGIAAPQATLMSMVVKGVMTGQLPWSLVIVGCVFGIMIDLMGLPVLPVALGIYLPIHLSVGILVGGIVRVLVDKKFKNNEELQKEKVEKGILLSSGLVAGEALVGIVIALLAALKLADKVGIGARIMTSITGSQWTATAMYLLLAFWIYRFVVSGKEKAEIKVDKISA